MDPYVCRSIFAQRGRELWKQERTEELLYDGAGETMSPASSALGLVVIAGFQSISSVVEVVPCNLRSGLLAVDCGFGSLEGGLRCIVISEQVKSGLHCRRGGTTLELKMEPSAANSERGETSASSQGVSSARSSGDIAYTHLCGTRITLG